MTIRVFAVVNMQLRDRGYVGGVNRKSQIKIFQKITKKYLTKRMKYDIIQVLQAKQYKIITKNKEKNYG